MIPRIDQALVALLEALESRSISTKGLKLTLPKQQYHKLYMEITRDDPSMPSEYPGSVSFLSLEIAPDTEEKDTVAVLFDSLVGKDGPKLLVSSILDTMRRQVHPGISMQTATKMVMHGASAVEVELVPTEHGESRARVQRTQIRLQRFSYGWVQEYRHTRIVKRYVLSVLLGYDAVKDVLYWRHDEEHPYITEQ